VASNEEDGIETEIVERAEPVCQANVSGVSTPDLSEVCIVSYFVF